MNNFDLMSALLGAVVMYSICSTFVLAALKSAANMMKQAMEFHDSVEAILDEETHTLVEENE